MEREKQIEEIRCENCIHHFACRLNGEYDPSPCRAYEDKAGYRKQYEGELRVETTTDDFRDTVIAKEVITEKGFIVLIAIR